MTRTPLTLALAGAAAGVLAAGLLAGPSAAVAQPDDRPGDRPSTSKPGKEQGFPKRIELPDGFQPEGIAIGPGPVAYFGSLADGDIYRAKLRTGNGRVISDGTGIPAVGLTSDYRGRLFVAGGNSGTARVVDTRSGRVTASYVLSAGESFVNDVVLAKRSAWFTDSAQPQLYRVAQRTGDDGPGAASETLPLTGDWVQGDGFGANGITTSPERRALLVVNSTTGLLYRVNQTTGVAREVDLGGKSLSNGDGLLRHGRLLYVVRNRLNKVAVVQLNRRATRGEVVRNIRSSRFDVPTTVARFGRSLYLPNARFGTTPTPTTEYDAVRVPRVTR